MKFYDFQYDGINLSDFGYMTCNFSSDGLRTVSNGSQLEFHTVPTLHGGKHELVSTEYKECLETTFQICKDPCADPDLKMSESDFRDLVSWLNRKAFHKFKILNDDYLDLYFEASFNISRLEMDDILYGLELQMITNRPFAVHEAYRINIDNTEKDGRKYFYDPSNEEGYAYPDKVIITLREGGTLSILNLLENREMTIKNCQAGEVITLEYPMIKTSLPSHKIQEDFNWQFFRIANTFKNKKNDLVVSLPCKIEILYSPVFKVVL